MAFLKSIWKANQKHTKLSEELALQITAEVENEATEDDINNAAALTFKLKYLGSTIVEGTGDGVSAEAVKNILKTAKMKHNSKKIQRVTVEISQEGIVVKDLQGNEVLKVSIYKISNCSTDSTHRQIFSFISTDTNGEVCECHAFLCQKRKLAETVTLSVAHAFSEAYEYWRRLSNVQAMAEASAHHLDSSAHQLKSSAQSLQTSAQPTVNTALEVNIVAVQSTNDAILIDFDSDVDVSDKSKDSFRFECSQKWVCFEEDLMTPQTAF